MIPLCRALSDHRIAGPATPRWGVWLGVFLMTMIGSCERSESARQVQEAKAALAEQQARLETLRNEQGKSATPTALLASLNWQLQDLRVRLEEGKTLEAGLAEQKAEQERAMKELEAVRAEYLRQHGGRKS